MSIFTRIRRLLCRHKWRPSVFQALAGRGTDFKCDKCGEIRRFYRGIEVK